MHSFLFELCIFSVTAFHCVVTDERFYVCAAKPDVSLGICYNFLADVQEEDQKGLESGNAMLGSLLVSLHGEISKLGAKHSIKTFCGEGYVKKS